jgi:hypothetical protein
MESLLKENDIESMMQSIENMFAKFQSTKDKKEKQTLILQMAMIQKKLDTLQAIQLDMFSKFLNVDSATTDDERVACLLRAFDLGAKLSHIYADIMPDENVCNQVMRQTYDIAHRLDGVGSGRRAALKKFLDDPHLDLRAMAAASLPDIMPDRAIPILKEIQETAPGTSAGNVAFTTLTMWKGRQKR